MTNLFAKIEIYSDGMVRVYKNSPDGNGMFVVNEFQVVGRDLDKYLEEVQEAMDQEPTE